MFSHEKGLHWQIDDCSKCLGRAIESGGSDCLPSLARDVRQFLEIQRSFPEIVQTPAHLEGVPTERRRAFVVSLLAGGAGQAMERPADSHRHVQVLE
jgi:hypothetical protein